jgi:hypothetical protein
MKIQKTKTFSISTSKWLVIFYNFTIYYLKLKHRLANDQGHLLIKLPVHPSTIEELALIRFWLLKLSQTHFEELYGILNPEFLSVLNPRTGRRKILFHVNDLRVGYRRFPQTWGAEIPDFAQFICARRLFFTTSILDEPLRNNLFKLITGTGKALENFRIFTFRPKQGEFCELLIKVYFDHYSYFFQICFSKNFQFFFQKFPNFMI